MNNIYCINESLTKIKIEAEKQRKQKELKIILKYYPNYHEMTFKEQFLIKRELRKNKIIY